MNDTVYDLINSISKAEKRYFRRYSSLHSDDKENKYFKLFELMDKSPHYKPNAIKIQLKSKYYAQDKRHLYTRLLDSLREFHKNNGAEAKAGKSIGYHMILLEKGLKRQAKKELKKATRFALKQERYDEVIKLMQMETKLLREETDLHLLDNHLATYREQLAKFLDILDKEIQYEQEYLNIVKWNKEIEFARTPKELNALKTIMDKPILKEQAKTASTKSKIYFHYIWGLYHFFQGSFTHSTAHFKKQLEVFNQQPHWKKNQPLMYIRCIGNYYLLNIKQGNTATNSTFSHFSEIRSATSPHKYYIDYLEHTLIIMQWVTQGAYKKATEFIESQSTKPNIGERKPYQEWYLEWVYVCFNSVAAYMGVGNYRMALKHLNYFLNTADANLKQDIYCIGRVLNLLIHFELENHDLLEYILESTQKYLKGKKRLFGFEKAILAFIKSSLGTDLISDKNKLLEQLKNQLLPLKNDPFEKNVFAYFDFIEWIDKSMKKKRSLS